MSKEEVIHQVYRHLVKSKLYYTTYEKWQTNYRAGLDMTKYLYVRPDEENYYKYIYDGIIAAQGQ